MLCVMLMCMYGVSRAQMAPDSGDFRGVRLSNVEMKHVNDKLHVTMSMEFGNRGLRTNCATIYTPVLYNNGQDIELQSVGIFGRNHYYATLREEHHRVMTIPQEWRLRRRDLPARVDYVADVEYESWMNGADLVVVEQLYGCNNELLASADIIVDEYREPTIVPTYLFVVPERVESSVHHVYSSAHVDFPQSQAVIDPNFNSNKAEIALLDESLDSLNDNKNIVVTRIVVRGSASPEGGKAFNSELAHERADALIEHINQHYNIPQGVLTTYYDTNHWADVRAWIAGSNIANRGELLAFIDNNAGSDNLNTMLMQQYPNQYQIIFDEYYPSLRSASYDVEYDVKSYKDVDRIVAVAMSQPMSLTSDELQTAASKVDKSSPQFDNIVLAMVAKNPEDATANLNAANVRMRRGELKHAERHLAKAGTSAEADYARALYALHNGNYGEAKRLLKRVEKSVGHASSLLSEIERAGK